MSEDKTWYMPPPCDDGERPEWVPDPLRTDKNGHLIKPESWVEDWEWYLEDLDEEEPSGATGN